MTTRRPMSERLRLATAAAMKSSALHLDRRFTEEISATKWPYPTPPEVRDIVDTGRLRASQTRTVNADGSVTFSWPTEYAAQVHEGGVALSGMRFPGRPWTKAPLEELPRVFARHLSQELERLP
jgi:hypothetical protein